MTNQCGHTNFKDFKLMKHQRRSFSRIGSGCYRQLTLLMVLLLVKACTTSIQVSGTVPVPRLEKIPLNIGIHFSEEFKTIEYEESIKNAGDWKVDFGHQNYLMTRSLFQNLFAGVTEVGHPSLGANAMELAKFDGLLVPKITKYAFLLPNISGLKFFSASIHYEIELYNSKGEQVSVWKTVGYGKSELSSLTPGQSLNAATIDALRDGGARIGIEMVKHKAFQKWMKSIKRNSKVEESA